MKKIISTLALATLAFGSVFADVTFTTNYRTRMVGFSRVMNSSGNYFDSSNKLQSYSPAADEELHNSYLFAHAGYGAASDDFKVAVSNDFAGAAVRVNPQAMSKHADYAESNSAFGEYYGYVNVGPLTLTAGLIDGISNGAYRLTGAVGHNLEGQTTDAYGQLGSMHKNAISFKADDISYFNGACRPLGMITYKGEFGDTTLTADLVAAAVDSEDKDATWDGKKMHAALGARVDLKLPFAAFQFVIKQHANKVSEKTVNKTVVYESDSANDARRSVALSVAPNLGENISLALGTSLGFYNGDLTDFNGDVRFVFKSGNMTFSSLNKIGYVTDIGATGYLKNNLGYDTHVGLYFLDKKGTLKSQDNKASQSSMWNLLAFRMELSDSLAVFCNVGDLIGFNAGKQEIGDFGMELFAAPGVQFFATKNASITTAIRFGASNLLRDKDTYKDIEPAYGILVPVVLRVQL